MTAYVNVTNADELQPGQAKLVDTGDQRVALFNVLEKPKARVPTSASSPDKAGE